MVVFDARVFLESLYADPVTTGIPQGSAYGIAYPEHLPEEWQSEWAERAAIREFDGGQAREHAEAEALTEILARMKAAGYRP